MMIDIVDDDMLETAYRWLCQRRRDYPPDADCWRFRRDWPDAKARVQADLLEGTYEIELLSRVTRRDGQSVDLWSARDAVVPKPWRSSWPTDSRLRTNVITLPAMAAPRLRCVMPWTTSLRISLC